MKFKDFLYEKFFPVVGNWLLHVICRTLTIHTSGEEVFESLRHKGMLTVITFWHGRHFLLVHYMGNRKISVVVSPSHDGSLIANILLKSGIGVVRGSSNRNPVRALIEASRQMKLGWHIGFTVDGPKGPLHKVKPGAIYLAKKMRAHIVPLTVGFSKYWQLKSWDQYRIPKPFSRAMIVFGTPYQISEDLSEETIEKECRILEQKLHKITEEADYSFETAK